MELIFRTTLVTLLLIVGCSHRETIPGVVDGASMAPTFLGEHYQQNCEDCGANLVYDASRRDAPGRIVCFNCGFRENKSTDARTVKSQQVSIHRTRELNRWDVVAFRFPASGEIGIKRVVGLPNEELTIRDGDLFKQGIILAKPLEIQKQIRVPVYDSMCYPRKTKIGSRWMEAEEGSGWKQEEGRLEFTPVSTSVEKSDPAEFFWLDYQHWRCCAHGKSRDKIFPLEDIDSFNPSESRKLNRMADIYVEVNFSPSKESLFACRLNRGNESLELQFDLPSQNLRMVRTSKGEQSKSSSEQVSLDEFMPPNVSVEISTFDSQLLVLVQNKLVFSTRLEPITGDTATQLSFLQLGAARGNLKINRVQLWRDVYYLSKDETALSAGVNEVILFGDNSVVSTDSRNWPKAGVNKSQIIGLVKNSENE